MNIEEGLMALVGATITGAALYGGDGDEGDGGRVGVYSLQIRCADGRDLELAFDTLQSRDMWIGTVSGRVAVILLDPPDDPLFERLQH